MKFFYYLILNFPVLLSAQIQPITQTPYNQNIVADNAAIQNVITLNKTFMGQSKLTGIFAANNYQPIFSNTEKWQEGSWFRGYFTGNEGNYGAFYNANPDVANTGRWSCHPQPRHTSKQVRAMIHFDNYYSNSANSPEIIKGLEYLISQQVNSPGNNLTDGGYIYWLGREGQDMFEQNDIPGNLSQNKVHVYETSSALAGLCEGYLYLKKNNIQLPNNLYESIVKAANNLYTVDLTGYNSDNYVAFGLWGLSKAYKITQDCRYLNKIIDLGEWLIGRQSNATGICNGTWPHGDEIFMNEPVYHEARINYHVIILRGLTESFDCIPKSNILFRQELLDAIKKATNHLIKYRVNYEDPYLPGSFFGTVSTYYSNRDCEKLDNLSFSFIYEDDIVETLAILAYYANFNTNNFNQAEIATLRKLLNIVSVHAQTRIDPASNVGVSPNQDPFGENQRAKERRAVQQMSSLAYYLDYTKAIDNNTKVFVVDNTNFFDSNRTSNVVSLDFNNDGIKNDIAYFETNGDKTFLYVANVSNTNIISSVKKTWESTGYPLDLFSDRVVAGDFDNDGKYDDIAVFFDYGNNVTKIHVFRGTGSGFEYLGAGGFWSASGYDAKLLGDRVISGDFDNDGKIDDIAAFYDYGNNETRIHVFRGTGTSFEYLGADGFWKNINYPSNRIISKVISGDFDNDGKNDDIATFYDHPNSNEVSIDVFVGSGTNFQFQERWRSTGYPFSQFNNRIVSGNFDNDGFNDIITFYDFGNNETRMHLFKGTASGNFSYQGPNAYWSSVNFDSNKIKGKLAAFDSNGDGKSEIFAMYNMPNIDSKLQTFKNFSSGFELNELSDWWNNLCNGYLNTQAGNVTTRLFSNKLLIKEHAKNSDETKIYKNEDFFEVSSKSKIKNIQLFDFSGKMVKKFDNIFSEKFRFNIPNNGSYIVKITDVNNKNSVNKIIN
ncbi:T9SS type A sorting domain-containing protein [Chryseobacterium nepalense]|uniref:T9SS type A sorting domain-containing protein n=1 Tax=Chryseobacterium nepalense TaxID=1854498 RepID=UPI002E0BD696|nr:hypothetical protein [Chryseobacterium nepalense]